MVDEYRAEIEYLLDVADIEDLQRFLEALNKEYKPLHR